MPDPQDLSERRARLTPEQRAKLQARLRGGPAAATLPHAIPCRPQRDQAPCRSPSSASGSCGSSIRRARPTT
ncbi:hypothetical protein ACFSHR_14685 [Azotobacter chroococcum]